MKQDIISEIDLLPKGIKSSPAKTAWEAISNGLVNIQQAMKYRETERVPDARSAENGRRHVITSKDVEEIVGYIKLTINNCLSATLPNLMLEESKTNKNMKKNVVKINENTLRQIVAESVKKVLMEGQYNNGCIVNEWKNTIELANYQQTKTGRIMNTLNNMKAQISGIQSQVPNMDDEEKDKLYQMLIQISSDLFNISNPLPY